MSGNPAIMGKSGLHSPSLSLSFSLPSVPSNLGNQSANHNNVTDSSPALGRPESSRGQCDQSRHFHVVNGCDRGAESRVCVTSADREGAGRELDMTDREDTVSR